VLRSLSSQRGEVPADGQSNVARTNQEQTQPSSEIYALICPLGDGTRRDVKKWS